MKNVSRGVVGCKFTSPQISIQSIRKEIFLLYKHYTHFFSVYLTMCLAVICLLALPMIPICE